MPAISAAGATTAKFAGMARSYTGVAVFMKRSG